MRALRAVAGRVAVLVVAMLAAIGAWEVAKGTVLVAQSAYVGVPAGTPTDHLVCYEVKDDDSRDRFKAVVDIKNQLETQRVKVRDHHRVLCVPTAKVLISLEPKHDDRDD